MLQFFIRTSRWSQEPSSYIVRVVPPDCCLTCLTCNIAKVVPPDCCLTCLTCNIARVVPRDCRLTCLTCYIARVVPIDCCLTCLTCYIARGVPPDCCLNTSGSNRAISREFLEWEFLEFIQGILKGTQRIDSFSSEPSVETTFCNLTLFGHMSAEGLSDMFVVTVSANPGVYAGLSKLHMIFEFTPGNQP